MIQIQIDTDDILSNLDAVGLSQKELAAAANRAYHRTNKAVQRMMSKELSIGLETRNGKALKRRIRVQLRNGKIRLFIGLNDLPVSVLKGRMKQVRNGVVFRSKLYAGFFVATMPNGKKSAWYRRTQKRTDLVEANVKIQGDADRVIRMNVHDDIVELFRHHFETDIKGRLAKKAARL